MMGSESVSIKRETEDDVDIPKKNQLCFREPDLEKMQIASPSVKREFKTEVDSPETKHLHLEAFPPNPGPEVSQTAPPSLKREADTELSSSKTKQPCLEAQSQKPPPSRKPAPSSEPEPSSQLPPSRPKRPLPTQECNVCNEDAATNQFKKFKTCAKKDCNKTCTFCWTKHIKTHGIEFPLQPIKCFGCEEPLEKEMVVKLLNGNERDVAHYEWRYRTVRMSKDGERECRRGGCKSIQVHDGEERVSSCAVCEAQDCTICDAPEHQGETCPEFQARLLAEHGEEEEATAASLRSSNIDLTSLSKSELARQERLPTPCPGCGILIAREGTCHIMHCTACSMHFCIRVGCGAKYLGSGKVVPLVGNAAHASTCPRHNRVDEDRRFVKQSQG